MPLLAQSAPIFGMITEDIDNDGNLDVMLVGNDFGMEPYSGRHDAFNGLCLKGDGKGNFNPMPLQETGFFVKGDAKGLAKIYTANNNPAWIATQNQDSVMVYAKQQTTSSEHDKIISVKSDDFCADLTMDNGKHRRVEFYYGSSYLSQSSRKFSVNDHVKKIVITNYKGQKSEVL